MGWGEDAKEGGEANTLVGGQTRDLKEKGRLVVGLKR